MLTVTIEHESIKWLHTDGWGDLNKNTSSPIT